MRRLSVGALVVFASAVSGACAEAPPLPAEGIVEATRAEPPEDPDPMVAGFVRADRWASAGHPKGGSADADLFAEAICSAHGRRQRRNRPTCERPFYKAAVADPARFARGLLDRRDPILTAAVLVDLDAEFGAEGAVAVARELDGDEDMWRAGIIPVARAVSRTDLSKHLDGDPRKIAAEARRHARATRTAKARGAALLVFAIVAQKDVSCYSECADVVDWAHFKEWFGDAMGSDDLASFLDVDPSSWGMADVVLPALGSGWSRAKVIVSRLAGHSSDYETMASKARAGERLLCKEGDQPGLREVAAYFRKPLPGDEPPRTALVASFEHAANTCKGGSPR